MTINSSVSSTEDWLACQEESGVLCCLCAGAVKVVMRREDCRAAHYQFCALAESASMNLSPAGPSPSSGVAYGLHNEITHMRRPGSLRFLVQGPSAWAWGRCDNSCVTEPRMRRLCACSAITTVFFFVISNSKLSPNASSKSRFTALITVCVDNELLIWNEMKIYITGEARTLELGLNTTPEKSWHDMVKIMIKTEYSTKFFQILRKGNFWIDTKKFDNF